MIWFFSYHRLVVVVVMAIFAMTINGVSMNDNADNDWNDHKLKTLKRIEAHSDQNGNSIKVSTNITVGDIKPHNTVAAKANVNTIVLYANNNNNNAYNAYKRLRMKPSKSSAFIRQQFLRNTGQRRDGYYENADEKQPKNYFRHRYYYDSPIRVNGGKKRRTVGSGGGGHKFVTISGAFLRHQYEPHMSLDYSLHYGGHFRSIPNTWEFWRQVLRQLQYLHMPNQSKVMDTKMFDSDHTNASLEIAIAIYTGSTFYIRYENKTLNICFMQKVLHYPQHVWQYFANNLQAPIPHYFKVVNQQQKHHVSSSASGNHQMMQHSNWNVFSLEWISNKYVEITSLVSLVCIMCVLVGYISYFMLKNRFPGLGRNSTNRGFEQVALCEMNVIAFSNPIYDVIDRNSANRQRSGAARVNESGTLAVL